MSRVLYLRGDVAIAALGSAAAIPEGRKAIGSRERQHLTVHHRGPEVHDATAISQLKPVTDRIRRHYGDP